MRRKIAEEYVLVIHGESIEKKPSSGKERRQDERDTGWEVFVCVNTP